jgi:hypothetical protein
VGYSESGRASYADPDTIRRNGNLAKVWELPNEPVIRTYANKTIWSYKALIEYNCTEEQTRVLAEYAYSGQMGNGEVVYSFSSVR